MTTSRADCVHGSHDINTQRCTDCGASTRERVEDRKTVGHPAQRHARPWLNPEAAHDRGEHDFSESQHADYCPVCRDAVNG